MPLSFLTGASWRETFRVYRNPRVLAMLFLGFSAGLPFLLVFSTLSAWLTDSGISRSAIGFFSWVGITYSIKVFWAPVVDRLALPVLTRRLGRRRSWMLVAQLGIAAGLVGMAFIDPRTELWPVAALALVVAFSSATQDISIDAYRIEAVAPEIQGPMASAYMIGYRLALLAAGAGAFYVAAYASWSAAYLAMGALMGIGIASVLIISEPRRQVTRDTLEREQRVIDFLERSAHLPQRLRELGAWLSARWSARSWTSSSATGRGPSPSWSSSGCTSSATSPWA